MRQLLEKYVQADATYRHMQRMEVEAKQRANAASTDLLTLQNEVWDQLRADGSELPVVFKMNEDTVLVVTGQRVIVAALRYEGVEA